MLAEPSRIILSRLYRWRSYVKLFVTDTMLREKVKSKQIVRTTIMQRNMNQGTSAATGHGMSAATGSVHELHALPPSLHELHALRSGRFDDISISHLPPRTTHHPSSTSHVLVVITCFASLAPRITCYAKPPDDSMISLLLILFVPSNFVLFLYFPCDVQCVVWQPFIIQEYTLCLAFPTC